MANLGERMNRLFGGGAKKTVLKVATKEERMQKWDTIESGIPNVYLLRNRNFEQYFVESPPPPILSREMSMPLEIETQEMKQPEHWPKSWTVKEVIWNSVGTLWAGNIVINQGPPIDIDNNNNTSAEPLLPEDKTSTTVDGKQEDYLPPQEEVPSIVEDHVQRVRNNLSWDYLVVYFDQSIPSQCNEESSIEGEGFFDGACTVSFRKPQEENKEISMDPYLTIGSLATERSLSEEDNERVTKSMVQAVVLLGQNILKDLKEYKDDSIWYKGFAPASLHDISQQLLVYIAFDASPPATRQYLKLKNEHCDDEPEEVQVKNTDADADFMAFWKDKIGFQDADREDNWKVLRKFRNPFMEDYQVHLLNDISHKKRKMSTSRDAASSNIMAKDDYDCIVVSSSSSESDSENEDDKDETKKDSLIEEFQSQIKLLVIK